MTFLPHLAARILNRPLLCLPDTVDTYLAVLGSRIGLEEAQTLLPEASRFAGRKSEGGHYNITDNGIAVIPIIGTLVNRGAYIGASSGLTSYEGMTEQLKKAQKDPTVKGILLDMATPGGEAAGCFDVSALIREIRKSKPVIAIANDMAASAGYAIASACDKIYVTQTSIVGSIGVIMVHFDRSKELAEAGITPTIIKSGAKKADGNPYGPLPKDVRERFAAEVDTLRDVFIASVCAGRPSLKAADVKATEAGCFMGEDAVKIGLADGLSSFDKVLESFGAKVTGQRSAPTGFTTPSAASATKDSQPMTTQTETPAQAAQIDPGALANARSEGATAERSRIGSILNLDAAKDRPALAQQLALTPGLTSDDATRLLTSAPAAAAATNAATTKIYEAIAAGGGTPKVAAGGDVNRMSREEANIARQTAALRPGQR